MGVEEEVGVSLGGVGGCASVFKGFSVVGVNGVSEEGLGVGVVGERLEAGGGGVMEGAGVVGGLGLGEVEGLEVGAFFDLYISSRSDFLYILLLVGERYTFTLPTFSHLLRVSREIPKSSDASPMDSQISSLGVCICLIMIEQSTMFTVVD